MRILVLAAAFAAALGVAACASSGRRVSTTEAANRLESRPNTIEAAILYGIEQEDIYLGQGQQARSRRTTLNWFVLASNIFVTAASGLDAHADSIFAGSLVGLAARSADPVLIPGGATAWSGPHVATSCVVGAAQTATTPEMMAHRIILGDYHGTNDSARAGQAALAGLPGYLTERLNVIRHHYLSSTIPDLLNLNAAAQGAIQERERAAEPQAQSMREDAAEELNRSTQFLELSVEQRTRLADDAAAAASGTAIVAMSDTIHTSVEACLSALQAPPATPDTDTPPAGGG
ncbi:MAG: hypothetical protein R3C25_08405 [Hyphomonadaceae bacterium]